VAELPSVTKILAPLLVVDHLPLRAVCLIGEAISADARLSDRGEGKTTRHNLDEIIELTDAYDTLQKMAATLVSEYEKHHDKHRIIEKISDIRDRLNALY